MTKTFNYEELDQEEIDEFHQKLCTIIEKEAKGDVYKAVELIKAAEEFSMDWMDTFSATGALWHMKKPAEWRCHICGKFHEAMAPAGAELGEQYDGRCPHCEFEGKLTVSHIP